MLEISWQSGTRRKRELLLTARWTTLHLCRGSADVAAAPVFPPSILPMLFLTFSLPLRVPLFSMNVEFLVLFPEPFFLIFSCFIFFPLARLSSHLIVCSFFRTSLFGDDQADPNFECMCRNYFECIYMY